jgi:two-component system NtrC family sensor kinase
VISFNGKAYYILIGFFLFTSTHTAGQDQKVADSLVIIYQNNTLNGNAKLDLLRELAFNEVNDLKRALQYAEELISLSKQEGDYTYLHRGYYQKGNKQRLLGTLDEALDSYIKSAEAARKAGYTLGEGKAYTGIADLYSISNNHKNAMVYYDKAIAILRKSKDPITLGSAILNAGDEFLTHKNYKAALQYFYESGAIFDKANYPIGKAYNLGNIGMVYANTGKNILAEENINDAIRILEELKDFYPISVYLLSMADIYLEKGDQPTALAYAIKSLKIAYRYGLKQQISDANLKLSEIHEKAGNTGQSLTHYKDYILYRDSVNSIKAVQKMADLRTDYEISQKQIEVDLLNQEKRSQRIKLISLFIILGLAAVIVTILYWYNTVLQQQKKEINHKSSQLEQSLANLHATQSQLIQKEKMASLGELTAGIAHEIQNPLNFVTNFSDLSTELIEELKEETRAERLDDVLAIADDLTINLQKIAHHGGRASAIVRGMLEHSRSSTGERQSTNLNTMTNEYLKIAYQGLRAKDKDFNCELRTDFDPKLPPMEIMPQEIGRVLLNLYNNAFYTLRERMRLGQADYQPTLTVVTRRVGNGLELEVKDNGMGIPDGVKGKIFQPFFTTKPTGEGTGLGLSLSYDIITKAHGGTLSVISEEGVGSAFTILLPIPGPGFPA